MPRVPLYDTPQAMPGVAPQARVQATPLQSTAAEQTQRLGAAAQQAGSVLGQRAFDAQRDINEGATREADNAAAEALRPVVEGYSSTMGKTAIDGRQDALKRVDEILTNSANVLTNDMQRQMFRDVATRRRQMALGQIDTHATRQTAVFNENETLARISNSSADAVASWAGWEVPGGAYAAAKGTLLAEFDSLANQRGMGEDQRKDGRLKALTGMHADVLNNMVSLGAAQQAKDYLDANLKEIAPDQVDQMRSLVNTTGVKDESLRLSLNLTGSLREKQQRLNAMFTSGEISADVRDATLQRAEHDERLQSSAQSENTKASLGTAQDWLMQNPLKSVQDLPPQLYNELKANGQLATITSFARSGRFDNDPNTWADIMTMPAVDLAAMTPTEFYNTYRGKLDDSHMEKGMAMVSQARGDSGDDKHLEIVTLQERLKQSAQGAGILPYEGKANESQAQQYDRFQNEVDRRVRVFERTELGGKRKASSTEVQGVIDSVLMDKVSVSRSLFFDKKKQVSALLDDEQMKSAYVTASNGQEVRLFDIPATQRATIVSKLQARKMPVTEQAVADLWVAAGKPR